MIFKEDLTFVLIFIYIVFYTMKLNKRSLEDSFGYKRHNTSRHWAIYYGGKVRNASKGETNNCGKRKSHL